ncbi:hypothetical protein OC861_005124 [Tilletia horrida]|nr:hypothetical protein OC861_005124 [Tilletia horrida]
MVNDDLPPVPKPGDKGLMPLSILEIVGLDPIEHVGGAPSGVSSASSGSNASDEMLFITQGLPWSFGYGSRAFGGTILAIGIQAAYSSLVYKADVEVANQYALYSFQGSFLSPTQLDRPLRLRVTSVRDTRSFVTRVIQGYQYTDDKQTQIRHTFVATADFARRGQPDVEGSAFSVQPVNPATNMPWEPPENLPDIMAVNEQREREYHAQIKAGAAPDPTVERAIKLERLMWTPISRLNELRPLPTSPVHETITAFDIRLPTSQDNLAVTQKTAADYLRWTESPHQLLSADPDRTRRSGWTLASLNAALLGLSLDYYLAGVGLFFSKVPRSAALFVSLDFSLRFHTADIDATAWHLREVKAIAGSEGRTFSEAKMWRENKLVATISQQCFCRPVAAEGAAPRKEAISQSNPITGNMQKVKPGGSKL